MKRRVKKKKSSISRQLGFSFLLLLLVSSRLSRRRRGSPYTVGTSITIFATVCLRRNEALVQAVRMGVRNISLLSVCLPLIIRPRVNVPNQPFTPSVPPPLSRGQSRSYKNSGCSRGVTEKEEGSYTREGGGREERYLL